MKHKSMACAPYGTLPAHHDECHGWVRVNSVLLACECDCGHPARTSSGRLALDAPEHR